MLSVSSCWRSKMDIHNYEKRYETGIEQVKTAKNKELILAFTNDKELR